MGRGRSDFEVNLITSEPITFNTLFGFWPDFAKNYQESGQLPVSRLGAMHSAGLNPTDSEAQELLSSFRVFDADGTGYLSPQKIWEIMRMGGNDFPKAKLQDRTGGEFSCK
eukprot:symbB.v1.2.025552.t1/scaffold2488.1/size77878/3